MMMRIFCVLMLVMSLAACGKSDDKGGGDTKPSTAPTPAPTPTPATKAPTPVTKAPPPAADTPEAKAQQIFNMRCVTCHGTSGKGDGPAAANLNPKPRNYTSQKWQETVTDQQIMDVIHKGGQAMGLSPIMPAQADLSEDDLKGLVALIRSFAEEE